MTAYTLKAFNGGLQNTSTESVSASVVILNGVQIVGPNNFNQNVSEVDVPVSVQPSNTLSVQVRGQPGGVLTIEIIGIDNDPPLISGATSTPSNAAGWNNSDVTVSFTCSDKTSGIALCPSATTITSEGANQVVSGTATDLAGNQATASVIVNIDRTPPIISSAINPPPDAGGWNSGPVTVSFTCSDALSGIATCPPPIFVNGVGANQQVTGIAADLAGNLASLVTTVNISTSFFTVRSYQGKCLDYGPPWQGSGSTVFLNDCSQAHSIRVEEIDSQHDVILHAGNQVIGIHNPTIALNVTSDSTAPQYALELQDLATLPTQPRTNQIFSLDGDSIILTANRSLVAQVTNARGANGTPLIVSSRNLADSEFWDFNALDGSSRDPTGGFVHVASAGDLATAIANGGYGTVVKVDGPITMSGQNAIHIPAGVTVRSNRRGTNFGQVIFGAFQPEEIFHVTGDDVRITQLHLEGPSSTTDSNPNSHGIYVESSTDGSGNFIREYLRTNIDHNDIFAFTYSAITADGSQNVCSCTDASKDCKGNVHSGLDYSGITNDPLQRPTNVHVARNYIHDNAMNEEGYGIDNYHGGYTFIEGNTFRGNRHSITGDGRAKSGYIAASNLIQTYTPQSDTHDFDMHGSSDSTANFYTSPGYGGIGGDYINIFQNTFLSATRADFVLRGQICNSADFHNNISLNDEATDSVLYDDGTTLDTGDIPSFVHDSSNPYQFGKPDPTTRLFVGDFDGDGFDDLFMATGAAWYYSPAGEWEWRLLSAKTETNDRLLFGDFDGDGRTDVVTIDSLGRLVVSWGGVSDWEVLNPYVTFSGSPADIVASMAVGDFIGDQRSDIFFADGTNWWLSDGGSLGFVQSQTSGYLVKDLRFGDFDGDGKTDVFGVVSGQWVYSKSAMGSWSSGILQSALTSSVDGLVVADFNADGIADVATNCELLQGCGWRISYGGTQGWTNVSVAYPLVGPQLAAVGVFRGRTKGFFPAADVLTWNSYSPSFGVTVSSCDSHASAGQLCISEYGANPGSLYGAQDMR